MKVQSIFLNNIFLSFQYKMDISSLQKSMETSP